MEELIKILEQKGILYEASDEDVMRGAEYDVSRQLVAVTDEFIVTIMYSMVLDPILYIYDRNTLEIIGEQYLYPEQMFCGNTRTWGSYCNFEVAE